MNNKSNFKSFGSLNVWQKARQIRNNIFELCKTFPKAETYKLADQMIRSSRSIGNNFSEGYGRYHYQENIQYCRQARGSAYELIDHLITALDCSYLNEQDFNNRKNNIIECIKMTNGYIAYLNRQKYGNEVIEDVTD
jgi:four helix bundle protein